MVFMVTEVNTLDDESYFSESAHFAIKDIWAVIQLVTCFVTYAVTCFVTLFVNCYSHTFYVSMSSKAALSGLTTAVRAIDIPIVLHKDCNALEQFLTCQKIYCKMYNAFHDM